MTAMTIAFVFCVVIFIYGLTLPPDKPKNGDSCGTDNPRKKAHC